jgi:hypothetical protein
MWVPCAAGVEVGNGSTLGPWSLCVPEFKIPPGQHWQGCPATAQRVQAGPNVLVAG